VCVCFRRLLSVHSTTRRTYACMSQRCHGFIAFVVRREMLYENVAFHALISKTDDELKQPQCRLSTGRWVAESNGDEVVGEDTEPLTAALTIGAIDLQNARQWRIVNDIVFRRLPRRAPAYGIRFLWLSCSLGHRHPSQGTGSVSSSDRIRSTSKRAEVRTSSSTRREVTA
jgi:hypothetical protein